MADKLRTEALCAIRGWHKKFAPAYHKLRFGFDYLKNVKKVKFDDNAQPLLHGEQQSRQDLLSRKEIVNGMQLDKLKKEMDNNLWEVSTCIVEIENCLELLLPSFDDDGITNNINTEIADIKSNDLRDIGLSERGYTIELDLEKIYDSKIEQTENNLVIVEKLKDSVKSANRIIMPRLKSWLTSAAKYGAEPSVTETLTIGVG